MIVVLDCADYDRGIHLEALLENSPGERLATTAWEIHSEDWDKDDWREWDFRLESAQSFMMEDEDTFVIWKLYNDEDERDIFGFRG